MPRLWRRLLKAGFKLLTGGTDNHLMLVDLRGMEISGKELQNRCDEVFITLNKNTVPTTQEAPLSPPRPHRHPGCDYKRLREADMEKIAECIWLTAADFESRKSISGQR